MCASHHHIFVYLSINLAFDGNVSIPTFGMTIDKKMMLRLNQRKYAYKHESNDKVEI